MSPVTRCTEEERHVSRDTTQEGDEVDHLVVPQPEPQLLDISSISHISSIHDSTSSSSSSSSSSAPSCSLCSDYPPPNPNRSHVSPVSHSTPPAIDRQEIDSTDSTVYTPTVEPKVPWWKWCSCRGKGSDASPRPWRRVMLTSEGISEERYGMFTRRQWLLLPVVCLSTLTSSFAICLFPPFFPKLAQEKGCSSTIFGLIIGMNCLTSFLVTPFIGKKLRTIGIRFAFTSGVFASGVCCILSGFLEWFPPGAVFICTSIVIRAMHATANALASTANFAYIGLEFPESMAKVFAWTRTCMNLAQTLGPAISGVLMEIGGFKLPFLLMGSLQVCMTMICYLLPPDKPASGTERHQGSSELTIWRIVTIPRIWIAFITFIFSTMSNGFLSINLEPQVLRKLGMGSRYVGILFGLKDGTNSLASPFWGWACDRRRNFTKIYIFISSVLAFISFFILGPFPGVPFERTVATVILSLSLNGVGIGGQQVAGVVDAMREAIFAGIPDEAGLHGCVAGLWASLSGVGRFISRTGSGYLVDTIGFKNTSAVVVALHAFVMLMTGSYLLLCGWRETNERERIVEIEPRIRNNKITGILTTSPADPVTTKTVSILTSYREDVEDSIVCGSAPIPTPTRYIRAHLASGSLGSSGSV